jgi:hypothetical protein
MLPAVSSSTGQYELGPAAGRIAEGSGGGSDSKRHGRHSADDEREASEADAPARNAGQQPAHAVPAAAQVGDEYGRRGDADQGGGGLR